MPVITVQMKRIQTEKKKELIERLTSAASEVTSIPESAYIVFIEEYEPESIGVGGQTLAGRSASTQGL